MLETIKKVAGYSKSERIIRIIEIAAKGKNASILEEVELVLIQYIREQNGEIAEVMKNRIKDEINENS